MPQDGYVASRCSYIEGRLQYAAAKSSTDPEIGSHLAGNEREK